MTLAEAVSPPARLASWNFLFLGVSVVGDSVHVEFVPCHSAGTLPSLHALTRCVLFGQMQLSLQQLHQRGSLTPPRARERDAVIPDSWFLFMQQMQLSLQQRCGDT